MVYVGIVGARSVAVVISVCRRVSMYIDGCSEEDRYRDNVAYSAGMTK